MPEPEMLSSEEVDVYAACRQPEMLRSSGTEFRSDRAG